MSTRPILRAEVPSAVTRKKHSGVKEIEFRALFDIRIGLVKDLESGCDQRILEIIRPVKHR